MRPLDLPRDPVPIETGWVRLVTSTSEPRAYTVLVNGSESSFLDLDDPARLEFEYMQQMMAILDETLRPGPLRAVHLGAAACALPRAIEARRPKSHQLAVELDGELAALVRRWFDLPRSPRLRIRVDDARRSLERLRPSSADLVVRDVFADGAVPTRMTTVEFARAAASVVSADGLYLANSAGRPPLTGTRAEVATLRRAFAHVAMVTEPAVLRGRRFGNVVLVGSQRPLPADRIARALRRLPVPARLVAGLQVDEFARTAPPLRDADLAALPAPRRAEA